MDSTPRRRKSPDHPRADGAGSLSPGPGPSASGDAAGGAHDPGASRTAAASAPSKRVAPLKPEPKPKPGRQPARPPRRAPGRPSAAADAPDLRARLLDAAIACYARQGIAATSLRAIAAEAGVNPALLHYYFGDKTQLQDAVTQERLLPIFLGLRDQLGGSGLDAFDLIGGFVSGIGRIVAAHPWLPSLWVREVLCEGGALRQSVLFEQVAPALPRMLAARFAQAQAEGRINPDLDPRLLMVSLIGLTLFPAASAPIWRQLFDAEDLDLDAQRQHALALLDRGLAP